MKIQDVYEKTKNLKVLFVEDEENVRVKTGQLLKELFWSVDIAVDGEEGLKYYTNNLNSHTNFYDIVITDINMPNLDGLSMVEKILRINPKQEIVVVSAYGDYEKLQTIINLGIKSYIKKPLDSDDFMEKLYVVASKVEEELIAKKNLQKMVQFEQLVQTSNQVYILFDKNCLITNMYKSKNINLFDDENIVGEVVYQQLYPLNVEFQHKFRDCFAQIDFEDNQLIKKLLTSTLPKEYILDDKIYLVEYDILSKNSYLLILSDQTFHYQARQELMMQKCECQMLLWAALHKQSFLKLKQSYEELLSGIEILISNKDFDILSSKIDKFIEKLLYYKEKFALTKMNNAMNSIIKFENEYSAVIKVQKISVEQFVDIFNFSNLKFEFDKDIKNITNELSRILDIE